MLFTNEVKNMEELLSVLEELDIDTEIQVKVAVVCFIFDRDGKLILHRRGLAARDEIGKLQAIGGSVNNSDSDFMEALKRELKEEAGSSAIYDNFSFIAAQMDTKMDNVTKEMINWIILAYKADLVGGELINMEPVRCVGFERANMLDFKQEDLSNTAINFINYMSNNE